MTELLPHIATALEAQSAETLTRITELILVVEDRECQSCGTTYSVPNPYVLARTTAPTSSIARMRPLKDLAPQIRETLSRSTPCSKLHVHTKAQICQKCFGAYEPEGQRELFHERTEAPKPERKVRKYERKTARGAKAEKAKPVFTLDSF